MIIAIPNFHPMLDLSRICPVKKVNAIKNITVKA